ncbi:MAG: cyclic nucleotide-binding domain-containing protein, partial [Aquificaceae bacterium]
MEDIRHYVADGYIEERVYEPKEVVFARMSQEDSMFIIEDGGVELYISTGSKKRTVDILLPGDVLGPISRKHYAKNYVAKALIRTYILYITADNLKR